MNIPRKRTRPIAEFRELFELHFTRFDAKLEQRIAEVKAELKAELHGTVTARESHLIRWMVGLWVGSTLTLIAAMVVLVRL